MLGLEPQGEGKVNDSKRGQDMFHEEGSDKAESWYLRGYL